MRKSTRLREYAARIDRMAADDLAFVVTSQGERPLQSEI